MADNLKEVSAVIDEVLATTDFKELCLKDGAIWDYIDFCNYDEKIREGIKKLEDRLKLVKDLEWINEAIVLLPRGGYRLYHSRISFYLLRGVALGANAIDLIQILKNLPNRKKQNVFIFLVAAGLQLSKIVKVGKDISLVPFNKFPNHAKKFVNYFHFSDIEKTIVMTKKKSSSPNHTKPESILFGISWRVSNEQVLFFNPECWTKETSNKNKVIEIEDLATKLAYSFSPKTHSPITILFSNWFGGESYFLNDIFSCGGSTQHNEIYPIRPAYWLEPFSHKSLVPHANSFLALEEKIRDQLSVSTKRLAYYYRRFEPVDRAIELGIAFESIFMKENERSEITEKLALRTAWFLGKSANERETIYSDVRSFYHVRSMAVHQGKLKKDGRELTDKCAPYCASAICKIVEKGKIPDWNKIILNSKT